MKFLRKFREYYIKVINSNDTPHGIALAVAIGIFIGCFLPIGTQTIPAILAAIIFRVDKLLTFASTWICNPYTVPFMYPIFCLTGSKIMGFGLTLPQIERDIVLICKDFTWLELKEIGFELGVSFFAGGLIYGAVLGAGGYFSVRYFVSKYRKRKKPS
ncbi:MAG TPA: hypothetical protein DD381_07735 [Lentisphaeria bacterium]|nr:MAG: hypothetical protein A2X47_04300 [Lentisphaerae bacterium GWF2_38_69]HBM16212.1 hypothetical protein [Lentisphaeria bacterium]